MPKQSFRVTARNAADKGGPVSKPRGSTARLTKKSPASKPVSGRKPSAVSEGTPASTATGRRQSTATGRKQSMQSGRSSIASTRIPTVRRGPSPGGGRKGAPTVVMVPAAGEEGEEGARRFLPLALLVGLVLLILAVLIVVVVLGVMFSKGDETNVSIINQSGEDSTGQQTTALVDQTTTAEASTATEASTTTSLCHGNAELVVILDASGSIFGVDKKKKNGRTFKGEQDIMKEVTKDLPIADDKVRVAVIMYATKALLEHELTDEQSTDAVADAIENLPCHANQKADDYCMGGTITIEAFQMARDELKKSRAKAKKVVMIVTDGEHNDGQNAISAAEEQEYKDLIKELSDDGVEIYASTVSQKDDVNEDNMLMYTSGKRDRYFIGDEALKVRKLIIEAVEAKPC